MASDEKGPRTAIIKTKDDSREPDRPAGLLGALRGGDAEAQRRMLMWITFGSWLLAAGAYGYLAGTVTPPIPESSGVYLLLGFGIGTGTGCAIAFGAMGESDD